MEPWLIYGATGYSGALIAEEAVKRGYRPLLGGRSADKLRPLAQRLGLDFAAFDLNAAESALREHQIKLVLHAAGPFIHTSRPMRDACLAVGAHYLDITGELSVFEQTFVHDQAARETGVALISGVGFDIVPSNCLIQYVADKVEAPHSLEIVVGGPGLASGEIGASAGTLKTNLEMIAAGFVVRRSNALVPVDVGAGLKTFRFADGPRTALIIPWGEVVTAYRPAGIANVTAYMTFAPEQAYALRYGAGFLLRALLQIEPLRRFAARQIEQHISGPSEHTRQTGRSHFYAHVTGKEGQQAEAWLETIEAYQLTILAAVNAVERVFADAPVGALTPAQAFGADFIMQIPQTTRQDQL
ncbi:MAG: saccharopine dehydrogenase [Chloroflexi bacterium]|nr:saccharopine dehydrogenase [Chloroflexota bacterium]